MTVSEEGGRVAICQRWADVLVNKLGFAVRPQSEKATVSPSLTANTGWTEDGFRKKEKKGENRKEEKKEMFSKVW